MIDHRKYKTKDGRHWNAVITIDPAKFGPMVSRAITSIRKKASAAEGAIRIHVTEIQP